MANESGLAVHLRTTRRLPHCIDRAAHLLPLPNEPVVYFISGGSLQHVKIGWTADLGERLAALQTGNPAPLCALAYWPGTVKDERLAHRHFADERGNGEWFLRTPAIERTIKALQREIAQAVGITLPPPDDWSDLE